MPEPLPSPLTTALTTAQAAATGLDRVAVRRLRRQGALRSVVRGVLAPPADEELADRLRAHLPALPVGAAFADETAAVVLGARLSAPKAVHLLVPRGVRGGRHTAFTRRVADLPADHVLLRDGVPVTTPARTLVDLLTSRRPLTALIGADAVSHAWPTCLDEVPGLLAGRAGQRGVARARQLLSQVEPRTESPMETLTRLLLTRAGLPRPVAQHPVLVDGFRFRLDLAWPDVRVAVEYDGLASHPLGLYADRDRAALLREAGWVVVVLTAEHVVRRPDRALARVRAALASRGA